MKPYQIVIGKFGSAVLQMMIYLSVLAPCICCTYLLRGVSIDQIWAVLAMCVGGSIALTILGLFLAGVFRSKTLGVGVSVLFVLFIGWLYVLWCILCNEFFSYGNPMDWNEDGVQEITFLIIALVGSTALLLLSLPFRRSLLQPTIVRPRFELECLFSKCCFSHLSS